MGAWIETTNLAISALRNMVAPLVGAWIETDNVLESGSDSSVAPLVGAWIETGAEPIEAEEPERRTPRGCVD